ncbi:hypothetical protein Salat_0059200 [Sesamum alatum]|uniref:Uncharacterized protein n=1 Tax=Sesamum alatum TaxID=300844 RepID=A0AAE2CWP4_9LAMI|nr:hypothetical protein Salat_0059200 [Sesamum alatum]
MDDVDGALQRKLDEVMPWIGLYIAVASAVCTLAIAADVFNGIRFKKLWFPCKYLSLNATSLTILGVAMKLPVDLNTVLMFESNGLARFSSLVFMSTAMANFISSLGSMEDKEILMNVVALGILVITIVVNVWIQVFQLRSFLGYAKGDMLSTTWMLLLLVTLVSSAITLPTSKRRLESKYQEMHTVTMKEEGIVKSGRGFRIDKRMVDGLKKYWVMAETSNLQFVMARSAICTTSSVICLFATIFLVFDCISWFKDEGLRLGESLSVYGSYTKWIIVFQTTGVVVGTIAPLCRWFTAVRFKCLMICRKFSFREELKIEAHWTQTLVYWRDNFSSSQIHDNKCWEYVHDVKWFALTFLIGVQVMIVLVSKLLVFIPALLIAPFLLCFKNCKKQGLSEITTPNNSMGSKSGGDAEVNLSRFVLLLDGEPELPETTLNNIYHQADKVIEMGKRQQPRHLIHLLQKFNNFSGVREFDSSQVPSLQSQDPPNCWSLPLVTLTSIAISLPNVAKNHNARQLMSSVIEGLSLVKLIEKTLDENGELMNMRNAADAAWARVANYRKWQEIDLRISYRCKSSRDVLRELSYNAETTVVEFKRKVNDFLMENPLNWPPKIIAANSMYRITRTLLLLWQEDTEQVDEGLFDQISTMIADILAACFTNLPHVIITMCHRNAIEKREKSVREAFLLVGKTGQILEFLQRQEWPCLDEDKAAYIEEWRTFFLKDHNENPLTFTSTLSDELAAESPVSYGEQITLMVDR